MRRRRTAAFTRLELLVVSAVIFLLMVLSTPFSPKQTANRGRCLNNLRQIGLAFRIFATDNGDRLPAQTITNDQSLAALTLETHFLILTNDLATPQLLHCPADTSRRPAHSFAQLHRTNISYFTSLSIDATRPHDLLAGDRNLTINGNPAQPGRVTLLPGDKLGWTSQLHNQQGNLLMADGSVQQFSPARLQSGSTFTNLLLLFP